MQDQVRQLCKMGIGAIFLNDGTIRRSFQIDTESVSMEDFKSGQYHFIYAHPETLTDNKFIGKILRNKQYQNSQCQNFKNNDQKGKEFRPAFSNLGQLTSVFAHILQLALTATATPEDLRNLSCLFEFHEPAFVILNPDRENIYYKIRSRLPNIKKYEKYDDIKKKSVVK
ncbi:hypothetical protein KUTeg_018640 [Tegillarca granosa]|uniref:Uncharacterized protein n=1 Tax=Tegillarca granosa TaxID=220873 RepID=A0ABQ9EJG8_TEGGR|nr:hypothetical protein KUTeg_018640 [Tegillarca granosa]